MSPSRSFISPASCLIHHSISFTTAATNNMHPNNYASQHHLLPTPTHAFATDYLDAERAAQRKNGCKVREGATDTTDNGDANKQMKDAQK